MLIKKTVWHSLLLVCLLGLSLGGCSTQASKSATFAVDTGDNIKVQVDIKAGYDLTMTVPFEVTKDSELVLSGAFGTLEAYELYYQLVAEDPNARLLAEGSQDGNAYFFYTVISADGQTTEYDYILRVGDSDTVVIMGSVAGQEAAEAAFAAISISEAAE